MSRRRIMPDEQLRWEFTLKEVITGGFEQAINETVTWLNSPVAQEYFYNQQGLLSEFFTSSGISKEWSRIIEERARHGADVTRLIYDYARKVNMEDHLVSYTDTERRALNRLCDYNYELIRNVTNDEITAIRRKLVQDYAEGRHPTRTGLKELQLQPINGWTPEQRAEVIARTESARTLNVSTLETMRSDGVELVLLYGCSGTCDTCYEYNTTPIPINEALDLEVPHPNCTGVWIEYKPDAAEENRQRIEDEQRQENNN